MKKLHLILLIVLSISSCESNEDILLETINRNDSILSYSLVHKQKQLFKNDTSINSYKITAVKNSRDTFYGYNFKIIHRDYRIFNFQDTLFYFNTENKIYHTLSNTNSSLKKLILPNHNLYEKDVTDSTHIDIKTSDGKITVYKKYDSSDEFTAINEVYEISKKEKQFVKIFSNVNYQNTNQFDEYSFKSFIYPTTADLSNEISALKKGYAYASNAKSISKNEPNKFLNMKGKLLDQSDSIDLNTFKEKIIVLDFWYMACYPCIKSIPFINKLYSKYAKEDIIVLGVNFVDSGKDKLTLLKKFKEFNHIKYPIFLTDENPYQVSVFPTIIVLDKDKKVIYHSTGYSEEKELELLSELKKALY